MSVDKYGPCVVISFKPPCVLSAQRGLVLNLFVFDAKCEERIVRVDAARHEGRGGARGVSISNRELSDQKIASVLHDVSDHSASGVPAEAPLAGTPPRPTVRAVLQPYEVLTKSGGCEVVLQLVFPHLQRTIFQHPGQVPGYTEVEDCQEG